jgi:hypothetical protein
MRDNDWDILVRSLQRQNCILLVGPDVQLSEDMPRAAMTDSLVAAALSEDMGEIWNQTEPLSAIAFRYLQRYSRDDLQFFVESFVRNQTPAPLYAKALSELASLPFCLVITSLYDNALLQAFRHQGKSPVISAYNFRGGAPANLDLGTVAAPLIYQIHGAPGEQGHLVITEQDLIDFLIAIVSKNPPLPPSIAAELQKSARSMLFLGFGVKHWYLRVLLHVLRSTSPDSRSFALEAFDGVAATIREQTVFFYKSGYKLEVFDESALSFIHDLRARFEKTAQTEPVAAPAETFPGGEPPRVFLSYASQDEEFVRKVSEGLRNAGMNPWMDRDGGLTGGADWDKIIEREIEHADYFLSFQSPAMQGKAFSYVNLETSLALRRQKLVRSPIRFVIPVSIGAMSPLDDLKHLQMERLDTPNDIGPLISIIKRDYQLRARQ